MNSVDRNIVNINEDIINDIIQNGNALIQMRSDIFGRMFELDDIVHVQFDIVKSRSLGLQLASARELDLLVDVNIPDMKSGK